MKVLFSAYACAPNCGSEPATGWNLAKGLSAKHDLTIMTRANNQEAIEASGEEWVERVHWCYLDPPRWLTFWKRGRRGVAPFYLIWQCFAFFAARRLIGEKHFDLVHHVTFASIAPASPLVFLGLPFVAGPLGGAEEPPQELLKSLPFRLRLPFLYRRFLQRLVSFASFARVAYGRSDFCMGATPRAVSRLRALGCRYTKVTVQSGLSVEELQDFEKAAEIRSLETKEKIHAIVASRLIYWKGVDIAIEAVAEARKRGVGVQLDILEVGPEFNRLKELAERLGVEDLVAFIGRLPRHEDVFELLAKKDVLLHPALNESFGRICIESLALKIPVICLDWGGPGIIVEKSCGYPVKVGTRDEIILRFADALEDFSTNQRKADKMREAAMLRAGEFSWTSIVQAIDDVYETAQRD